MTVDTTSILRIRKPQRRLGGRVLRSPAAVLSIVWLVGLILASEVLKLVLGLGETLVGRLLLVDVRGMRFRELAVGRNPECLCRSLRVDPTS